MELVSEVPSDLKYVFSDRLFKVDSSSSLEEMDECLEKFFDEILFVFKENRKTNYGEAIMLGKSPDKDSPEVRTKISELLEIQFSGLISSNYFVGSSNGVLGKNNHSFTHVNLNKIVRGRDDFLGLDCPSNKLLKEGAELLLDDSIKIRIVVSNGSLTFILMGNSNMKEATSFQKNICRLFARNLEKWYKEGIINKDVYVFFGVGCGDDFNFSLDDDHWDDKTYSQIIKKLGPIEEKKTSQESLYANVDVRKRFHLFYVRYFVRKERMDYEARQELDFLRECCKEKGVDIDQLLEDEKQLQEWFRENVSLSFLDESSSIKI